MYYNFHDRSQSHPWIMLLYCFYSFPNIVKLILHVFPQPHNCLYIQKELIFVFILFPENLVNVLMSSNILSVEALCSTILRIMTSVNMRNIDLLPSFYLSDFSCLRALTKTSRSILDTNSECKSLADFR